VDAVGLIGRDLKKFKEQEREGFWLTVKHRSVGQGEALTISKDNPDGTTISAMSNGQSPNGALISGKSQGAAENTWEVCCKKRLRKGHAIDGGSFSGFRGNYCNS
jgi:hypothetical protein